MMESLGAFCERTRGATLATLAVLVLAACGGSDDNSNGGYGGGPTMGGGMDYAMRVVVSDAAGGAYGGTYTDSHLVNGWGVAFNPQGFVWVSDAGTSTSTLYDGNGVPQSLVVSIPDGASGEAEPTGIVFSGGSDFVVTQGAASGPSRFIFAGEGGTISAWSPTVNATNAITVIDGGASGSAFTGLALAAGRLFAANFGGGTVDVFDGSFAPLAVSGGFVDATVPAGYAPFGIQAVGGEIVVTYAMKNAQTGDEVTGAGLGLVDVFDTDGKLLRRLVSPGGVLNAPWGVARAPADFGRFSNALLVGNFGDGRLHAFDLSSGALLGTLSTSAGTPLSIDGLWGIAFGNGLNNQPTNTLFFAAGPGDETHGAYGRIDVN